jgi:predicted helicase
LLDGVAIVALRPVRKTAALKAVNSLDALLDFLRDELDWPIPPSMHLEDAGVPINLKEIHLDPKAAAKMEAVYRLLPPTGDEPFGVYFVEFSGGKFPVGALKRFLEKVVRKKRTSRSGGQVGRWGRDDLIFITRTDENFGRAYLTAFETDHQTKRTRIKVISWGPNDTEARLKRLIEDELPRLRWPHDGVPLKIWIGGVKEAFRLGVREEIRTSDRLAQRMADVAIEARDEVLGLLEVELDTGPLKTLLSRIREKLLSNLTEKEFADMYSQTLVYGLLVARLTNPEKFAIDASAGIVDFGTPLLDELYRQFRDPESDIDVDELGLIELANELRDAPVEEMLDNFGAADRRDDPVVHFYEDFLERFDPADRKDLGAYYTVVPVVKFMVNAVNDVLTEHFGLDLGIADQSSWKDVSKRLRIPIPDGVDPENRFVNMLDPATGTGTFLLEWLRKSKQVFLDKTNGSEDDWSQHFDKVMLPTMAGFEIRLAPYAVAHLKTALEIPEGSKVSHRLPIYLTNTLLPPTTKTQAQFFSDPLADEGLFADKIKDYPGITVMIGNPPYKDKVKGDGPAVEDHIAGQKPLLDDFTPRPERGLGAHTKILRNRYVYFWRWGLDHVHGRPQSKPGIVAFITSSAWLEGPVFETMRSWIRSGNHVWVVDLGGSVKNAIPGDENVFSQITIAVAICIVSRAPHREDAALKYIRLRGSRKSKFEWLEHSSIKDDIWNSLDSDSTAPIGVEKSSEWQSFVALGELMPFHANGIHQQRTWVNDPSKKVLVERWKTLANSRIPKREKLMKITRSRNLNSSGIDLETRNVLGRLNVRCSQEPASIVRYSFRTLDRQWLIADSRVIDMPSPELWKVRGKSQIFLNELHSHPVGAGPAIVVAPFIPNLDNFHGRGGRVVPVFRSSSNSNWNLLPGALNAICSKLQSIVTADSLVAYVVGITAFPAFSARFSDDLQQGGVRIPITLNPVLFSQVAALGTKAVELFTYCERTINSSKINSSVRIKNGPQVIGDQFVPRSMPESGEYDSKANTLILADLVIGKVRPDVWAYEVTGMPVVKKWIGYRKASPTTKWSSPLNDIVTEKWPKAFTEELLDLLHVLTQLRDLEPEHTELLQQVLVGPTFDNKLLWEKGLLPPPHGATVPTSKSGELKLD